MITHKAAQDEAPWKQKKYIRIIPLFLGSLVFNCFVCDHSAGISKVGYRRRKYLRGLAFIGDIGVLGMLIGNIPDIIPLKDTSASS